MHNPLISVVMAVFNGAHYLHLAIDSVLTQSFRDFEFVIIDDCSTDNTPDIISSYNDERIVYMRNNDNLGQTPSLNLGLRAAKGKYIARIDADDIYLQGKLQRQFVFMETHPEVSICGTAGIKIDEHGKEITVHAPPRNSNDIFFSIFFIRSPLIHVSVIMRKDIIMEYNGYDERYPYCADFALWSTLIKNKLKIANIHDVLIKYREYSGSIGAIHKLKEFGWEMASIICSNMAELLNMRVSHRECMDIVLLLFPQANVEIEAVCNAYLNLMKVSRAVYTRVPLRIHFYIKSLFFWSLVKRRFYANSSKDCNTFGKDLPEAIKMYYGSPLLLTIITISYFSSFIGEKSFFRIKRLFDRSLTALRIS